MTILVVDDYEQNRYQLQVLLGASGHNVVTAADGAEALALARQNPPDLIVSDVLMPVMDGFTLCREWTRDPQLRAVPFVFYTATYTDARDEAFALSLGACQFIVKPLEPEDLLRRIQEALQPAGRGPAAEGEPRSPEEAGYLREYNDVLIRKLEDKMRELEQANRTLQEELATRRKTEDALRDSEERYRQILDSSLDAVLLTVPDGRILSANPAACRMFGRSEEELRQLGRAAVVDPSDPQLALALEERTREGQFLGELTLVRSDGSRFPVEISSALFHTAAGEPRTSMIIRDASERRRAEAELCENEALLDEVSRIAKVGGWEMDLLTRKAHWTLGTYDIVEVAYDAPIPGPDEHLSYYLPAYRGMVAEAMRALIDDDKPLAFEAPLFTAKGNTKWCRATGISIREKGRCVRLKGTLQDITDRKQSEAAIQEQLDELRRWHEVTLGREGRVLELKKEINTLLARLGEPPKYSSAEEEA